MSTKILALLSLLLISSQATADDWPQWFGPQRDGVWRETGIVDAIPAEGLPIKWRKPIHGGYSGPAVVGNRVFVMDYQRKDGDLENNPGQKSELTGNERIACYAADSGDLLWEHAYEQPYSISYASGPRCTPTVDAGKVYALGAEGRLTCLDAESGEELWYKSLTAEYNTKTAIWGYSSHPLIDGDLVITLAGGMARCASRSTSTRAKKCGPHSRLPSRATVRRR